MASLRGGQKVWESTVVSAAEVSPIALIGPGPYVAVYVSNKDVAVDAVVVTVQVAVSDSVKAGRNAISTADDGGLEWFNYTTKDGHAVTLTVAHGVTAMVDLSPFAPAFIRLKRTDAGADAVLSAWVSAFGAS